MTDEQRTPQPGDHVEIIYRGVLGKGGDDGPAIRREGAPGYLWLPGAPDGIRVIDPPEPTRVNTIVTGWRTPGDSRDQAMYVYALLGRDEDGDGRQHWANASDGIDHEYAWSDVLDDCAYGRRIIEPSAD